MFGSHTGAIIATRFASRYPDRLCALVANGILLTSTDAALLADERVGWSGVLMGLTN